MNLKTLTAAISLLALTGCEIPTGTLPDSLKELNKRLNIALQAMLGNYDVPAGRGPIKPGSANAGANSGTPAPTPEQEKNQLLHEMFQVVLLREPATEQEFAGYLNALIQGASLEGIYNGFVNSDYYTSIENKEAAANPATVHMFALVVSTFQHELSEMKSSTIKPTDLGVSAPFDLPAYEKVFSTNSLYKLKRILGAEALKVIAAKREASTAAEPDKLAQWYSSFAVLMAGQGVDFGLALRNRSDFAFHMQWFKGLKPDIAIDRVTWEVLNRVHRLLNVTEARANSAKNAPGIVGNPAPAASPGAGNKSAAAEKKGWEILTE